MRTRPRARFPAAEIPAKVAAIEAAAATGRTIAAACQDAGVSLPSFYRWRQRLRARQAPRADAGRPAEPTRDVVLNAARTVFMRDGAGASISAVAKAAGVTRQTIHNLFGGRDRLFGEVAETLYLNINAPVLAPDPAADLLTVLNQVGRHHMRFAVDPEAVSLMRIALGEYKNHPELASVAYALRAGRTGTHAVAVITEKLVQELERGTIREINPYLAAETFIGSFSAFTRHRALIGLPTPSEPELEERLQLAIDLFVRGINYQPKAG